MPRLVRWFVKAAFLWLILALALKAASLSSWGSAIPAITPVSWHALFVGWLTQLIFGIAHWMLPTIPGAPKERLRGDERLMWGVFFLLNSGLLMRVLAEPMVIQGGAFAFWRWMLLTSAWLQWLAAVLFVINSWRRARPAIQRGTRG